MKKLIGFNPELITITFFPDLKPKRINSGQCFEWAYLSHLVFQGVELWDMTERGGGYAHAFVKYRHKFYDAQRPLGEKDWRDLPACNFGARSQHTRKYSSSSFRREWNNQTIRYGTSWREMEVLAIEMINLDGTINDS